MCLTPSVPQALILPTLGYTLIYIYSNRESPGNPRKFKMQGAIPRILVLWKMVSTFLDGFSLLTKMVPQLTGKWKGQPNQNMAVENKQNNHISRRNI